MKYSFKVLEEKTSYDLESKSSECFKQFACVKQYCSEEKLNDWNTKNVSAEARWVEIFCHLQKENVLFDEFSTLIEYVFCFPGTSTPAERIFSRVNKIWKSESSSFLIKTIKSILIVQFNMEFTCPEFHRYLITRENILKKISTQEKYDFKKPNPKQSPGAMSVDFEDNE